MALITDLSGLETAMSAGALAEVDSVIIETDHTISVSQLQGWGLWGRSAGWHWPSGVGGVRTAIKWTGSTDPTAVILNVDRALDGSIRDIAIDGDSKAGIGILFTSDSNFGTGRFALERVNFQRCTVAAVQCGQAANDFNCADITYNHVSALYCGSMLKTVNHQSVNHVFTNVHLTGVNTGFNAEKGGNISVFGGHASGVDLLLNVGYGGVNAGRFLFQGLRMEDSGHTNRYTKYVSALNCPDMVDITMVACHDSQGNVDTGKPDNYTDYLFEIGRNVNVELIRHAHRDRPKASLTGGALFTDRGSRWMFNDPSTGRYWKVRGGEGRIYVEDARSATSTQIPGWKFD